MEYILINEGKLKVMLDHEDLAEWDIRVDELDYSNPEAKYVFEDILQYAREELGFDTSGHKVLLQMFPSCDGGCELFITRLPKHSEKLSCEIQQITKEKAGYKFDKLSQLLSVCKRLYSTDFSGESSAWRDVEGKWYLLLSRDAASPLDELPIPTPMSFISEYAEEQSTRALSLYLGEYAQSVCAEDAVRTLGKI